MQFIPVSARTGYGLSDLEACIALLAESLLHLSLPPPPAAGAPVAAARGFVLEVRVHPKRGRVLHAIVRSGYLQEGAWVAVGPHYGRIKKLYKPQGGPQGAPIRVPFAGMNEAVEIAGLGDLEASAGQLIVQTKTQQQAAKLAAMAQRALEVMLLLLLLLLLQVLLLLLLLLHWGKGRMAWEEARGFTLRLRLTKY